MIKLMQSPGFIYSSLKLLQNFRTPDLPKEVLNHFYEYYQHLTENDKEIGISSFYLLSKLFLLRLRGGHLDVNASAKTNDTSMEGNDSQESPSIHLANEIIELFEEIVNTTVNLGFSLEKIFQNHRHRYQQVSNKFGKKNNDKPNYLKSMPKQMRIFVETLKSLSM
jgi:DNA-binding XRE family transcriptional regulator